MYRLLLLLLLAGCSTFEIHADATYTQSTSVEKLNVADHYLSLPPPPISITRQDEIFTPPPNANYQPILDLLHKAPGGSAITLSHLQSLTPFAMALVPIFQKLTVANMTWQQLFAIPQIASAYFAAQSLLQPLGLWNQTSLTWLLPVWQQFIAPLKEIYAQLTAVGTTYQPPDVITKVNPIQVLKTIDDLRRSNDWLELAEVGPGLIHSLVKHLGYVKPLIILYGSKARNYAPAIWTQQDKTNYTLSQEEGFQSHTLTEEFYQGDDDISLNYFSIVVKNKSIETLDIISSERSILLKRMSGGDINLLERAETRNTSMLSVGMRERGFKARVVAGRTSYSELGGATLSLDLYSTYASNHIAVGAFVEGDRFVGYAENELTLYTPHVKVQGDETAEGWLQTTIALSGMSSDLKFQGDARVIPEVHGTVTIHSAKLHLYGGGTIALAPKGSVNLSHPDRSIGIVPIRAHVGAELKVRVSENWDVHASGVIEVSKLYQRQRARVGVSYRWLSISGVAEFRNNRKRYGGSIDIGPLHVQGLWPDLLQAGVSLEY